MKFKKAIGMFFTVTAASYASITSVFAQGNADCGWLPPFLCNLVASDNPVPIIVDRVRVAFFIVIGVIILVAIAYGIYNAYKYIKSGGGDGMEEANKGMRSILIGIASIFVILLGIAAVLMFFGANFLQVWLAATCISAPNGAGCYACQNQGLGEEITDTGMTRNQTACNLCNSDPKASKVTINVRSGYEISSRIEDAIETGDVKAYTDLTCDTPINVIKSNPNM